MPLFTRHLPRRFEIEYTVMDQRLPIDAITKETIGWSCKVEDNEQILILYTLRSSSVSTSSLTFAPIEDEVFPISTISDLSSQVQTFPAETKISLPDRPQFFYLLACSRCNHFLRIKTKKMVQCFNCKQERMLVPSVEQLSTGPAMPTVPS
ncbi:hypothetical protein BC332_30671 [Capsicum chinense]|nr:hypothetical protein BC332_30671 [Capsicum chinense]